MTTRTPRTRLLSALVATVLLLGACGDDDDVAADQDDTTTTEVSAEETSTTTEPEDEEPGEDDPEEDPAEDDPAEDPVDDPEPAGSSVPGAEVDPTAIMLDDKAILLGGFFGVRIPDGWAVTTATLPVASIDPPGGETEADPSAIDQVLVMGPEADPRAATFALLHYSHSDAVPGLEQFADGIREVLGGDGTLFTEPQSARIGGQEALLHQLQTPDGDSGLFVALLAGDEYFFILSIVSDDAYAADAGELVASISMEPAVLP